MHTHTHRCAHAHTHMVMHTHTYSYRVRNKLEHETIPQNTKIFFAHIVNRYLASYQPPYTNRLEDAVPEPWCKQGSRVGSSICGIKGANSLCLPPNCPNNWCGLSQRCATGMKLCLAVCWWHATFVSFQMHEHAFIHMVPTLITPISRP